MSISTLPLRLPVSRARREPIGQRLQRLEATVHHWCVEHGINTLRITHGAVFLAFGFLKFFPDDGPAQQLAQRTTDVITLGLLPGGAAIAFVAALECAIGLCLLTGRAVRTALYLLTIELVGILSPIVLLPSLMFGGPDHAPTIAGQYVLKDIIMVGAAIVLAASSQPVRRARRTS